MRGLVDISKTLDEASAGDKLVQNIVDPILVDLIEYKNPLRKNLPRRTGQGSAYILVRRTAAPTGAYVSDTETPTRSQSTYAAQTSFPYKTLLVPCSASRKMVRMGKSWGDILAEEMASATREIRQKEEYGIIEGNTSSNSKQFNGLKQLIPNAMQLDLSNAVLTKRPFDKAIDLCHGYPDLVITSKRSRRDINGLLSSIQRFVDKVEVKGGFRVIAWDDIPIFVSTEVADTDEAGAESSIYIVDTSTTFMSVLTELTTETLAKVTSQLLNFDVYEDLTLVSRDIYNNAWIKGIKAAGV